MNRPNCFRLACWLFFGLVGFCYWVCSAPLFRERTNAQTNTQPRVDCSASKACFLSFESVILGDEIFQRGIEDEFFSENGDIGILVWSNPLRVCRIELGSILPWLLWFCKICDLLRCRCVWRGPRQTAKPVGGISSLYPRNRVCRHTHWPILWNFHPVLCAGWSSKLLFQ